MAVSSNKHGGRATTIKMTGFSGGLALDRPAELLEITELAQADNVHFDVTSRAIQSVPGLRPRHVAEGRVSAMFWSTLFSHWLFVIEGQLYKSGMNPNDKDYSVFTWTKSVFESTESVYSGELDTGNTNLGYLTGANEPCFLEFGRFVCIASGGALQIWNGVELKSVEASKPIGGDLEVDLIFRYGNRMAGAKSGDDIIFYSSPGDPVNWEWSKAPSSSDEDLSKAQWHEVGWLDSARIVAIGILSNDLVICKRTPDGSPIIYRVTGRIEDGSLAVLELNRSSDVYNSNCLIQANNDLFYFGSSGFQSFATVQQYGDIKMADIGQKVNVMISRQGNPSAKMWHIRPYNQIWIQPARGREIYIYHYAIGAFTVRLFRKPPSAIHVVDDEVYVALEDQVFQLDKRYSKDSWGYPLVSVVKSNKFRGRNAFVIKKLTAKTSGEDGLLAEIRVGKAIMPLRAERRGREIYGNNDPIYGNTDEIYSGSRQTGITRKQINHRLEEWQLELIIREGRMTLDAVEIDVVEVN